MRMKAGSMQPPMTILLTEDGEPITGLGSAVAKQMVAERAGVTVITDNAPSVDAVAGSIIHTWVDDETATKGRLFWKAGVDFGSGMIWFPPYGEEVTDIE